MPVSCLPAPHREPSPCCRVLAGSGGALSSTRRGRTESSSHTARGRGAASSAAWGIEPTPRCASPRSLAHGELNRWGVF